MFAIPYALHGALTHLFSQTEIEHHLSWFITDKLSEQPKTGIDVWVRSNIMDVMAFKTGNILLINSFNYHTPEDFAYHFLHVMEQLEIDTEKSTFRLFNDKQKPELRKLMQKYISFTDV